MEAPIGLLPRNYSRESEYSKGHKRLKLSSDGAEGWGMSLTSSMPNKNEQKKLSSSAKVIDYTDPFAIPDLFEDLDCGKYGSVTKDIQALQARKMQMLCPILAQYPSLKNKLVEVESKDAKRASDFENQQIDLLAHESVVDLEKPPVRKDVSKSTSAVVIIDSDEDDEIEQRLSLPFKEVVLNKSAGHDRPKVIRNSGARRNEASLAGENNTDRDRGVYVGVQEENNHVENEDDGLGDIWTQMTMALESSKDVASDPSHDAQASELVEECHHSFILKDDIGYVCRVCGLVDRGIETIFEFQYVKVKRSTRTYMPDSSNAKEREKSEAFKISEDEFVAAEVSAHPRHAKQMKPHQIEGFNFLLSNLVGDNPGGCILAHAPGSGKTFMIICFMQSFLAKYPQAKPLVVLPKGILSTWKKELQTWQVEDIPLYDFYTAKADSRAQQLEVLKQWVSNRSILFLGYKQFSTIVCDSGTGYASLSCQEILLKAPTILILDEGHTPRNEDTNILQSLAKVQTLRKVVLSGTLYQNHVKEVFNILNLVRPKFLRQDTSRAIVKRIMSRVHIPAVRKQLKAGGDAAAFYELIEHTLQKDTDFKRKVSVIQDLRELTNKVLHYYKGDFLDELPGLFDFTVVLNLSSKQKREAQKLKNKYARKFKITSVGSAVYLHPNLNSFSENTVNDSVNDSKMDATIEGLEVKDGVKAKFILNMLGLCEAAGEKLLVFSQYLLPLKFLERLVVNKKCWSLGREVFVISGDSSSEQREFAMDCFNKSPDAKVFFGSIKACGEGISLVGASRIIILDVPLNPSVTRQAIGRAFRPGQKKKVYAYRLVAAETPEEEDHSTSFNKELISKMWFEWNEYCGYRDFSVNTVDVDECDDLFLESPALREDVKVLYKR